jgi:hypothetical protein
MPECMQKFLSELSTEDANEIFSWFEVNDGEEPFPKALDDFLRSLTAEQLMEVGLWTESVSSDEGGEEVMDIIAVTHIGFRVF